MLQAIRATYKDGKLHPLEPLQLAEGQTVSITVSNEEEIQPEISLIDEVTGQRGAVIETPFHQLAKLAAQSGIEFDESFHTANPDEIIEDEFGDYLVKQLQEQHGANEDSGR